MKREIVTVTSLVHLRSPLTITGDCYIAPTKDSDRVELLARPGAPPLVIEMSLEDFLAASILPVE